MTQRKLLQGGVVPHELTLADRQKAAAVTNEKRRLQGLSLRARVAEKLDAKADAIVDAVLAKAKDDGDGKDFLALWKQTHGQPAVEVTGEDGAPLEVHVDHDFGNLIGKLEQAGVLRRGPETAPDA